MSDLLVRSRGSDFIVVFAHGFRTNPTEAFHRVSDLVHDSISLVVPKAKSSSGEALPFKDFDAMMAITGLPVSKPVVVIAHSGGYESVLSWMTTDSTSRITAVVLLDALYAGAAQFAKFANTGKLISIGVTNPPLENTKRLVTVNPRVQAIFPPGLTHDGVHKFIPNLVTQVAGELGMGRQDGVWKWLGGFCAGLVGWKLIKRLRRR